ncbi:MAG: alpha/beta hydrolase [Candidatus Dormibacteraceae bacterium]
MKNAIILHGARSKAEYYDPQMPSASNQHWLPWLQQQLLIHDIPTATVEVPWSFDRNWKIWQREVERFDLGPETILVGHSTGAGFWIKYLSINEDLKVDKVLWVAPWLDPDQEHTKHFFDDFEIDPNLLSRTKGITIFNSDNDLDSVQKTVKIVRNRVKGITYRKFHNYGHFCFEDMKTREFPELIEVLL